MRKSRDPASLSRVIYINFPFMSRVLSHPALWLNWTTSSSNCRKVSTLPYKGGYYERDLSTRLGIPSVNLERYSYPKVELLFDDLVWLETCGDHTEPNAYHHCAKVEVETFGH